MPEPVAFSESIPSPSISSQAVASEPTPNDIVALKSVSKIYPTATGEFYAVRDISIAIRSGEFYSILGSSGSGKTTTLRLIGGFEIPEQGQVWIGGEAVTTLPPYRRDVHTVFQSYALFPHLTVAQNIAYPLTIAKVPRAEIIPRVAEALRMFQIETLSDRRPTQLSGGQQQRVALARALISRPKVLLLDEPLSALDAKIREEVRQELRELQRRTGITFIYVTHDQEEALALSDRIAVMHNGRVEQVGTPQEIYQRPASSFVAQFIGKANFLPGTVLETNAELTYVDVQGQVIKAIAPHAQPAIGATVTLMIRPEQIRLSHAPSPAQDSVSDDTEKLSPDRLSNFEADNAIVAKPVSVTYIGQLLESQLDTPIGRLTVTQLGGSEPIATPVLAWKATDCLVLSAES